MQHAGAWCHLQRLYLALVPYHIQTQQPSRGFVFLTGQSAVLHASWPRMLHARFTHHYQPVLDKAAEPLEKE